jgi:RNA polymerase sigma-70 factor (ECF subfamily)
MTQLLCYSSGLEMSRPDSDANAGTDATVHLLERARRGDSAALDDLFARHLPLLQRWASGRLPRWARDIVDTSDLVQETVFETFKRLDGFEPRGDGALQAYLRQAFINRLRNQLRKAIKRPAAKELDSALPNDATSPLEAAIGRETLEHYEAALQRLTPDERDAVVMRIELGFSYAEIAAALGKPSPDAARMMVVRALVKLANEMDLNV